MSEPSRQEQRHKCAENILYIFKPITFDDTEEIFVYNEETGLYEPGEKKIQEEIQNHFKDETTIADINETIAIIRRKSFVKREEVEKTGLSLIPLQNGIFDLETETMIDYSRKNIVFFKHPVSYDAIAGCPAINNFLDSITENDLDKKESIIKMAGYCFYRSQKYKKAFMLLGKTNTGKTTFLNLLIAMLGKKQVSNMQLQEIIENRFAPGNLYRKSANIFDDLSSRALKNPGVFQALTGCGQLDCDRKFKEPFKFENLAKLIFACNKLPKPQNETDAFYQRWEIIKFSKQYLNEEKKVNLIDEITSEEELSGFFNLCMNGLHTVLEQGYPDKIDETRELYEKNADISKAFCYDCLELNLDGFESKEKVWQAYIKYCKENDAITETEKAFYHCLTNHFEGKVYPARKRTELGGERVWLWEGVKIKKTE